MPIRMLATTGTVADCTQVEALIDGIPAEHLLVDWGYDTNKVLAASYLAICRIRLLTLRAKII